MATAMAAGPSTPSQSSVDAVRKRNPPSHLPLAGTLSRRYYDCYSHGYRNSKKNLVHSRCRRVVVAAVGISPWPTIIIPPNRSHLIFPCQKHPSSTYNFFFHQSFFSITDPQMSSPGEYYRSLPPVTKAYGVLCLMASSALHLQLYDYRNILLFYEDVLKKFQVWRLVTNFFFLGPFSIYFGLRLVMLARYGVLLEKGPFKQRTADFFWMVIFGALSLLVIGFVPFLRFPFLGPSLVFMMLYVWSREVPNSQISIFRVVTIQGVYLPWAMLVLDLIFNNPLKPDILGILAGHMYYFLAVLYPLSGGKNILKTPLWVHKLVVHWGEGVQANSPVQPNQHGGVAFRGRSYRLNR